MANSLDPMDLKQIITLHLGGVSNRKIASILGISRNTANNIYMKLFSAAIILPRNCSTLIIQPCPNYFPRIPPLMSGARMSLCFTLKGPKRHGAIRVSPSCIIIRNMSSQPKIRTAIPISWRITGGAEKSSNDRSKDFILTASIPKPKLGI